MFDRYTERARRALAFARFEAGQVGHPCIEPEHLLLGLLREGQGITHDVFTRAQVSIEQVRGAVIGDTAVRTDAAAGDLPLSVRTKRVLEFAHEEATSMQQRHLHTAHLLLGILREPDSRATRVLTECGLRLQPLRENIRELLNEQTKLLPSYDVRISLSARKTHEGTSGSYGADYWTVEGADLKAMLATLYGIPRTRIEWPAGLDDTLRYDFFLLLPRPEPRETMTRLMQEGIERHFAVAVTVEPRERDAYVLTAPNGRVGATEDSGISSGFWDVSILARDNKPKFSIGGIQVSKSTIAQFADMLERGLDRLVIDETNLTGAYDLKIDAGDYTRDELLQAIRDDLGLVATAARREVNLLVVRPKT